MPYFPKCTKNNIVKTNEDIKKFLAAVVKRTVSILKEEVKIKVIKANYAFHEENQIKLTGLTSIISIEDCNKITVVFDYDDLLLKEIFIRYTKTIKIEENETQLYIDETASDLINIIIGNVLSQFGQLDVVFHISTPIIIRGTEYVAKFKDIKAYTTKIKTEFGQMRIFCIVPGNTFLNQFQNLQGE